MRYIEAMQQPAAKPEKEAKPNPKFGGKDGNKDYSALMQGKKIPTKGGYK